MSDPAARPWTVAEFFIWQAGQRDRHELVGGRPARMMAGARNVHDDIVVNLLAELRRQLRGRACRPFTGDGAVETLPGQIRRPDAGVDCGVRDPDGLKAALPRLVAEVLSPGTRDIDTLEKLAEYRAMDALEHILLIETNAPEALLWSREADRSWCRQLIRGLDATIVTPSLDLELPLAELYDGVVFPAGPRPIRLDEARDAFQT
jgi:Uma2 family endonuclease